ncbi:hypothetical protein [Photorhabdus heterorhabditis]|uniref:hypothetical protein n=1 Tax=Photorhabdus heterorhabditis TaxID=880156 RepID=UPI000AE2E041|nr:hypothetical protein [Photorhabdus heterorhabditis]
MPTIETKLLPLRDEKTAKIINITENFNYIVHSLFHLGAIFGVHQDFALGTGFSSISYPEFGLNKITKIIF